MNAPKPRPWSQREVNDLLALMEAWADRAERAEELLREWLDVHGDAALADTTRTFLAFRVAPSDRET